MSSPKKFHTALTVDEFLNTVVGSLRSSGFTDKANVIQKKFENMSDEVANPLNLILEGKNNKDKVISAE